MKTMEDYVREAMEVYGQDIGVEPSVKLLKFRKMLMEEEIKELFFEFDQAIEILERGDSVPKELYVNMLKEMADVQFVLSGASVTLKPLQKLSEAFIRVHESNMSKLDNEGKPIYREDGKVLKGPNYRPPDLTDLV